MLWLQEENPSIILTVGYKMPDTKTFCLLEKSLMVYRDTSSYLFVCFFISQVLFFYISYLLIFLLAKCFS